MWYSGLEFVTRICSREKSANEMLYCDCGSTDCVLRGAETAQASKMVDFDFDPADFFEFQPLGPGGTDNWSDEGGMFKLHEEFGVEGPGTTTLRSWFAADRPSLDAWKASLEASEGIGFFNTDVSGVGSAEAWGQSPAIAASVISLVGVSAPAGWTTFADGNNAAWEATSLASFLRPGVPAGTFGFTLEMDDAFDETADYTFWFGGFNFTGFLPAVEFDSSWGGDVNEFASIDGTPGSGFEASLRLQAIPEPSSVMLLASCVGLLVAARRRSRCASHTPVPTNRPAVEKAAES